MDSDDVVALGKWAAGEAETGAASQEPSGAEDRTEGGRWIVVDGRRWRATDPSIPDSLRQELVNELMAARRAVGSARRSEDASGERSARSRVQNAKLALGERGEPWWQEPTEPGLEARLRATIAVLTVHRAPDATICPSDVARTVGGQRWRKLMDPVRRSIRTMAEDGVVEVTQRGALLDPAEEWRGPIRVRRPRKDPDQVM